MLKNARAVAMIPCKDLDRAKKFYQDTLGFKLTKDLGGMAAVFEAGHGTSLIVFPPNEQTTPTHTVVTFTVDDVTKSTKELAGKGITFEDYSEGPLRTNEDHVAKFDGMESSWFKDSEGNILSLANA